MVPVQATGRVMAEREPGFLGRWSQRKTDAVQGKPLADPASTAIPPAVSRAEGPSKPEPDSPLVPATAVSPVDAPPPALSIEDAARLTQDSDFKPFMAGNVSADVRNAAMKKLFADPHFNVMDGLDIYIDDYSISEPIPESMLRQMTSAKFLNLFDDEAKEEVATDLAEGKTSAGQVAGASASPDNADTPQQAQTAADPLPPAVDPTSASIISPSPPAVAKPGDASHLS